MWQAVLDFFAAHKEAILSAVIPFVINELIAINPKFFSGSIGQLIINAIRKLAGLAPVSIPSPKQ